MSPLQLSGFAGSISGFAGTGRLVVRMLDPNAGDINPGPNDAAIIRSPSDIASAVQRAFTKVIAIGNVASELPVSLGAATLPLSFGYLAHGDIIRLDLSSRRVRSLYRRNSSHNFFLVTERCNHYCLMCSQPPRDVDDDWLIDEIAACVPLIEPAPRSIGFTGGEPFLEWRRFVPLIAKFQEALPDTNLHVLTNGRFFADQGVANAWAALNSSNLCVGIPIYSSVDSIHDHIVQARGALDETVHGILRLKDKRQRVEIRVVLHALTAPHLLETSRWLARNLPFVDHVALMGLENTGFALANQQQLWIDPEDYREDLATSVQLLAEAHIPVSVYNLPRCVLSPAVWSYAVQSISDWKNAFLPECGSCNERPRCGGFFSTGRPRFSRGVRPFQDTAEG